MPAPPCFLPTCAGYKDSKVAAAEQAFREALCREVQEALAGQDVVPMKYTGQLYKDGHNFAQV